MSRNVTRNFGSGCHRRVSPGVLFLGISYAYVLTIYSENHSTGPYVFIFKCPALEFYPENSLMCFEKFREKLSLLMKFFLFSSNFAKNYAKMFLYGQIITRVEGVEFWNPKKKNDHVISGQPLLNSCWRSIINDVEGREVYEFVANHVLDTGK